MASVLPIYNVKQDYYGYSTYGELVSQNAAVCVIVVVIFNDNSLLVEHWSDPYIGRTGGIEDVMRLVGGVTSHVIDIKGKENLIRHVFFIGGCNSGVCKKLQKSLVDARNEITEGDEDVLDLPNVSMMQHLFTKIKLIDVIWNIPDKKKFKDNEPYINVGIVHHQQDGYYLFVKQCINLDNSCPERKVSVCCGSLSYNLNLMESHMYNKERPLNGGEFFVTRELAKSFTDETSNNKINNEKQETESKWVLTLAQHKKDLATVDSEFYRCKKKEDAGLLNLDVDEDLEAISDDDSEQQLRQLPEELAEMEPLSDEEDEALSKEIYELDKPHLH